MADKTARSETRRFARDEFERHRGVTDIVRFPLPCSPSSPLSARFLTCLKSHIRYLLSTGKTEWENMERYIGGM